METVVRVLFVYVFLMFALRVMGKREFSEFSPLELVVLLLIPEMLQQALVGHDPSLTNALVATCTLLLAVFGTSLLSYLRPGVERAVESEPSVLAHDGKLVERNLRLAAHHARRAAGRDPPAGLRAPRGRQVGDPREQRQDLGGPDRRRALRRAPPGRRRGAHRRPRVSRWPPARGSPASAP